MWEATIQTPISSEEWHPDAVRAAYASDDPEWRLTAVFAMRWVRGFDEQIMEAIESGNPELRYQAVCATGNGEIGAAWSHVSDIITSRNKDKDLLLAAIEAAPFFIPPTEAGVLLLDLAEESDDEDIVEAAQEAMSCGGLGDYDEDRRHRGKKKIKTRAENRYNDVCFR